MAKVTKAGGVTIRHGISMDDRLSEVERHNWPHVMEWYRRRCQSTIPNDCRGLLYMIDDAEKVGWAGYETRDRFIWEGLGIDPEAVGWALRGLLYLQAADPSEMERAQTLDAAAGIGRRAAEAQILAATVDAAPTHGGKRERGEQGAISTLKARGSTHAATLAARLKRDAPDVADRLAAGEFPSVRAACIAAGIKVAQTATIRTDDVSRAMAVLLRYYAAEAIIDAVARETPQ